MKHSATLIALVAASVLGVAACGSGGGSVAPSHTARSAPGTPQATASAATTPTAPISRPMRGQELLWLQAVEQLLPKMNKVFNAAPTNLTSSALASLAHQVRGCNRELARIGSPSARLQPVYELVQQACREYDKGAKCFEDAARMGSPFPVRPLYKSLSRRSAAALPLQGRAACRWPRLRSKPPRSKPPLAETPHALRGA